MPTIINRPWARKGFERCTRSAPLPDIWKFHELGTPVPSGPRIRVRVDVVDDCASILSPRQRPNRIRTRESVPFRLFTTVPPPNTHTYAWPGEICGRTSVACNVPLTELGTGKGGRAPRSRDMFVRGRVRVTSHPDRVRRQRRENQRAETLGAGDGRGATRAAGLRWWWTLRE